MITSTSNQTIKMIRKLQDRKQRRASGLFYCEGLRIVIEAVRSGANIQSLLVCDELLTSPAGLKAVEDQRLAGIEIIKIHKDVFETFSSKDEPQGLAAIVKQAWSPLSIVKIGAGSVWVALDSVADPGNLGTILRTADATNAQGVLLIDQSTDPYDPTAVRASMGAVFGLQLVRIGWAAFLEWKLAQGVSLIGTSSIAQEDYHYFQYPDPLIILMGSERQGLQASHLAACDHVVSIPMAGQSDSLNLAVATALILYEVVNQRRNSGKAG